MNPEFCKNLITSALLHGIVLLGFIFFSAFAPKPKIETVTFVELVGGGGDGGGEIEAAAPPPPGPESPAPKPVKQEEAVTAIKPARVEEEKKPEMVLPKEEPKKKPAPSQEEAKKPEPPKKKPIRVSKKLVTKRSTTSRPRQLAENDSTYSRDAIRKRLGAAANSVRIGAAGGGPDTGSGPGGPGSQFADYYSMLSAMLYDAWEIPATATSRMSTTLLIRIGSDGALSYLRVVRSSGNSIMDQSAISAVRNAGKLPPPAGMGSNPEVTVTFEPLGG